MHVTGLHLAWHRHAQFKHVRMHMDVFDRAAPRRAQAWPQPAVTEVMPSSPGMRCGFRACTQPRPSPSWPRLEVPQAHTVPSVRAAKEATPEPAMLFTCASEAQVGSSPCQIASHYIGSRCYVLLPGVAIVMLCKCHWRERMWQCSLQSIRWLASLLHNGILSLHGQLREQFFS